jgi:hypothetical protein
MFYSPDWIAFAEITTKTELTSFSINIKEEEKSVATSWEFPTSGQRKPTRMKNKSMGLRFNKHRRNI